MNERGATAASALVNALKEAIMSTTLEENRPLETLAAASDSLPKQPRIVIIGGGFAGIAAARALRRCAADVVLIDRRNHHIFQPLLYQVATAVIASPEIAARIRQLAEETEESLSDACRGHRHRPQIQDCQKSILSVLAQGR